jgi:hypothetical protein
MVTVPNAASAASKDQRDRRAVRRQHLGETQPQPARRPGDEADPAAEIEQFRCLHARPQGNAGVKLAGFVLNRHDGPDHPHWPHRR